MNNIENQKKDCEKVINSMLRTYKGRGVSEEKLREVCHKKTDELFEKYKDRPNFNILKDIKYTWFIRNEITRTIIENTEHIKVNREKIKRLNEYLRTIKKLKDENSVINSKEISEKMNISEDEVRDIEKFLKSIEK